MRLDEARAFWERWRIAHPGPHHVVYDLAPTRTICDRLREPGDEAMPAIRLEVFRGLGAVINATDICPRCWQLFQLLPPGAVQPVAAMRRDA